MDRGERPLLAVLIDADNVPARNADAILREISDIGEPALRRVYGDWSSPALSGWQEKVRALGMVAHQQTANTKGKNASDIGLVIDAMDILHTGRFDGFVLVSSDSDFTQLANRLREDGRLVIGIGERKTPPALRIACNRFIFIENIDGPADGGAAVTSGGKGKSKGKDAEAARLIRAAMGKIDQEDPWFSLGPVGQHIAAAHPDFDARTYGARKLSDLVKALPREFETRAQGNHLQVRDRRRAGA
ncbi:MAG: NYN domain-containing protein [Pseudomonadota bacterium]